MQIFPDPYKSPATRRVSNAGKAIRLNWIVEYRIAYAYSVLTDPLPFEFIQQEVLP